MQEDIIPIFTAVISVITALILNSRELFKGPDPEVQRQYLQEKEALLSLFRLTSSLSCDVKEQLSEYIQAHDLYDDEIYAGTTYQQYLAELQKDHRAHFSNKAYRSLENGRY